MNNLFTYRLVLLATAAVLVSIEATSQSFFNTRGSRDAIVSFGTGVTSYYGDLNDPGDVIDTKLNANIGLQHFFTNRIAGRAEFTWFQLTGDDSQSDTEGRITRNLSFTSNNFELNAVGIFNVFPNGMRFYQRSVINFYGFAGIGLIYFNPKGEVPETGWDGQPLDGAGDKVALQPIQTEGVDYSRTAIVIPYGVGVKYMVNPFVNIAVEGGYRQTFTDYLDDVSTQYVDNSSFDDPVHAALADRRHEIGLERLEDGHKRGNPDNNDGYFIFNVKIEYYLPARVLNFKSDQRRRRPHRNIKSKRR